MANIALRYDNLLPNKNADVLKRMVVTFGGRSSMRKDECIEHICSTLGDPIKLSKAVNGMGRVERAALRLMKIFGGESDLIAIALAVQVTNAVTGGNPWRREYGRDTVESMCVNRGLVMVKPEYYYSDYRSMSSTICRVFTDERILDYTTSIVHDPLLIEAVDGPTHSTYRSAQRVFLDVISLMRSIDEIRGVGLTRSGDLRINDVRKVAKKMAWGEHHEFDAMPFNRPAAAFVGALHKGGILTTYIDELDSDRTLDEIANIPPNEIIRRLVQGIAQTTDWNEQSDPESWQGSREADGIRSRAVVLASLCCLPDPRAWFRFDDLEVTLFRMVGHEFSITGRPPTPDLYGHRDADEKTMIEAWRSEIRNNWLKSDVPWLQAMFQSWLYAFGLLEISVIEGKVDRFRLTDAARFVLFGESPDEQSQVYEHASPAWIVQPNFDVVVYINVCSPIQLTFLQQYAARISVSQHTAQYRITRDSVYAGIQRGGDLEEMIGRLAAGSGAPLPGNVVSEIRTWAGLTERITIRHRANLLEFGSAEERQKALDRGVDGLIVGDRLILLREIDKVTQIAHTFPRTVDYAKQPGLKSLNVSEDGLVKVAADQGDLITMAHLDSWAVRESDASWRLTLESVNAAIQEGRNAQELITLLRVKAVKSTPSILEVAIRAWAGGQISAGVGEAAVVRFSNTELLRAVVSCASLKPYIIGRIGNNMVIVKKGAGLEELRAKLEWVGVDVRNSE